MAKKKNKILSVKECRREIPRMLQTICDREGRRSGNSEKGTRTGD